MQPTYSYYQVFDNNVVNFLVNFHLAAKNTLLLCSGRGVYEVCSESHWEAVAGLKEVYINLCHRESSATSVSILERQD